MNTNNTDIPDGSGDDSEEMRTLNERLLLAGLEQLKRAEEADKRADDAYKSGEMYRLLARNFPDAMVLLFDHDLRHVLVEGKGFDAPPLLKEALEDKTVWEGFSPRISRQLEPAYRAALAGETVVQEVRFAAGAGDASSEPSERLFQVYALPLRDDAGNLLAGMALLQDVTEQRQTESEMRWQANHDVLTGLPNRGLLHDRLEQVLSMSERSGELAAILFLDLDHFKHVNDTRGHGAGDRLLQAVARRLTNELRTEDTVARIGGDEFLLLLPSLHDAHDADRLVRKVGGLFDAPFVVESEEIVMKASIGLCLYPRDGQDAESLLRCADDAMYRSKRGKGGGEGSDRLPADRTRTSGLLETELRLALVRGEFVLLYQPLILLGTGQIGGVEALVRWRHPELGLLAPALFLSAAEKLGMTIALGEWVLEQACREAVRWRDAGYPVPVSVNLSVRQFGHPALADQVARALSASGLGAAYLGLDISEGALLQHRAQADTILRNLKGRGVRICVDNFGAGFSSLAHLRQLPLDALKVDQGFVRLLGGDRVDPADRALVQAMIDLAHALKMEAVSEGIETENQRDSLARMGCDAGLGYLFHAPLPAEEVMPLFRKPLSTGVLPS